MKFAILVAIVNSEIEERAIEVARQTGAGGVTIVPARGMGDPERKTFLGLTYQGNQTILIYVLEKKLALQILKALNRELKLNTDSRGIVFTLPLEHLAGIDLRQLHKFENQIKQDI